MEYRAAKRSALFVLQIPEAVERVQYQMECKEHFLPEGALAGFRRSRVVLLLYRREGFHEKEYDYRQNDKNNEEILFNPLLAEHSETFGIVRCVSCGFEVCHCLFVLVLKEEVFAYSDISGVKVVVSLENFFPFCKGVIVIARVVILNCGVDKGAVFRALEHRDNASPALYYALTENINIGADINNRCRGFEVAELASRVTEGVKKLTAAVVGEYSGAVTVDCRPRSVRSEGDVNEL